MSSCNLVQFVRVVGCRRPLLLSLEMICPWQVARQVSQHARLLGLTCRSIDSCLFTRPNFAWRWSILDDWWTAREGIEGMVNDPQVDGGRYGLEDCEAE